MNGEFLEGVHKKIYKKYPNFDKLIESGLFTKEEVKVFINQRKFYFPAFYKFYRENKYEETLHLLTAKYKYTNKIEYMIELSFVGIYFERTNYSDQIVGDLVKAGLVKNFFPLKHEIVKKGFLMIKENRFLNFDELKLLFMKALNIRKCFGLLKYYCQLLNRKNKIPQSNAVEEISHDFNVDKRIIADILVEIREDKAKYFDLQLILNSTNMKFLTRSAKLSFRTNNLEFINNVLKNKFINAFFKYSKKNANLKTHKMTKTKKQKLISKCNKKIKFCELSNENFFNF